MTGYVRQSSYTDGAVILAEHSNDEFNQLVAAFHNNTGHKHDGTTAEGPVIGLIGDAGISVPLNKIVVDTANDRIGVFIDVASSAVEQVRFQDGAIIPVTDDDIDLGTASLEFKDAYFDGTVNLDALVIGAAAAITDVDTDLSAVSASDDTLASAKAVKAYADSVASAAALATAADSGTGSINISTQSLTIAGGTGLDSVASGQTVTLNIDSTVATLTGSQTLTNKTLTSPTINGATLTGVLDGAGVTGLGIGTSSPSALLDVHKSTTGNLASFRYTGGTNNPRLEIDAQSDTLVRIDTSAGTTAPDLALAAGGSEAMRIDSSGNVGIGTSSPNHALDVEQNGGSFEAARFTTDVGGALLRMTDSTGTTETGTQNGDWVARTANTARITVTQTGNVGIGVSSPSSLLQLSKSDTTIYDASQDDAQRGGGASISVENNDETVGSFAQIAFRNRNSNVGISRIVSISTGSGSTDLAFVTEDNNTKAERMRIDSSGDVGIGTSSPDSRLHVVKSDFARLRLEGTNSSGTRIVDIVGESNGAEKWRIGKLVSSSDDFQINIGGTERMRILSNGTVLVAKAASSGAVVGIEFSNSGILDATGDATRCAGFNRLTNDGTLVRFQQDTVTEGSISVSGTTVSYNGAHMSRWSQLPGVDPSDKSLRPEILRGTVLTNLDEMCEWGDEDNEQLNRMDVSSVKGDRNVAGVFQDWDDDDDEYLNDFYCAMTGDFVIRIAGDCVVQRGDLLMSAGDGTACPQEGELADVVRSCTVAKVTSINKSHTYDDGSYLVPCVLMAC